MLINDMIGPSSASSEKEGKTKEMPEKSDPHKHYILQTGQITCHDTSGRMIDGDGSGQDADFRRGVFWPAPRFEVLDDAVLDRLTGLAWTRNAITPAIIYHNLSSPLVRHGGFAEENRGSFFVFRKILATASRRG